MMAQQLRVHPALAEDLSSVPNTHVRWLTTTCNSSSRDPTHMASECPVSPPPTHTHTCLLTHKLTHKHTNKIF